MNARMKKRREETLYLKLGREQFEYMDLLEQISKKKPPSPQERAVMLEKLTRITGLYVQIKREKEPIIAAV